jgi:hypothetical protein
VTQDHPVLSDFPLIAVAVSFKGFFFLYQNDGHNLTPSDPINPKTQPKSPVLTAITLGRLTFISALTFQITLVGITIPNPLPPGKGMFQMARGVEFNECLNLVLRLRV